MILLNQRCFGSSLDETGKVKELWLKMPVCSGVGGNQRYFGSPLDETGKVKELWLKMLVCSGVGG